MSDLSRRAVVAGTLTVIAGSEAVAALAEQEKNKAAFARDSKSDAKPADKAGDVATVDNEVGYHEFPEPITALCALPGGHNVCVACGSKLYIIKIL